MAAKSKRPKKFKQARSDAKSAAKNTFSGKSQARLKDPTMKLEAIDKQALSDVAKEAKGNYITDAQGNKIQTKPTETAAERFKREHTAKAEQFRAETGAAEPKATTKKAAVKKAAAPKKAAAAKPAVKKPAAPTGEKVLKTPEGKARYEKLIKEGVKPKSAMNKALFYEGKLPGQKPAAVKKAAAPKAPAAPKGAKFTKITDASLTAQEDAYRQTKVDKLVKEGKLSGSKEIAIRPKSEVIKTGSKAPAVRTQIAKPVPGSDTIIKKGSKLKKFGKGGLLLGLASEVAQIPQSMKDQTRKDELEDKIAKLKGKKPDSLAKNLSQSLGNSAQSIANSVTMGLVGKRRSDAVTKLEAEYKKAFKDQNKKLRYGPNGESLVPGTDAYKKGSKTRPKTSAPSAGGAAGSNGGGSSSGGGKSSGAGGAGGSGGSTITSGAYTVKSGDTLSAIAKRAGVKLEDIYATNKKFKTNPKYKGGNMIWSGTKVNIPTKK